MSIARNTARRDRHRKLIARGRPPCHLCGGEIDFDAHHLEPLSFQIDHVVPLNLGGDDDLANLAAAHRACNRNKSDRCGVPVARPKVFVTARMWA